MLVIDRGAIIISPNPRPLRLEGDFHEHFETCRVRSSVDRTTGSLVVVIRVVPREEMTWIWQEQRTHAYHTVFLVTEEVWNCGVCSIIIKTSHNFSGITRVMSTDIEYITK